MTAQSITQGRKPSQQFTPQPQYNPNIQNNPTRISSPQTMNPQFGQPVRRWTKYYDRLFVKMLFYIILVKFNILR